MSLPYTLAAFYAGNEGSLLLWSWLLAIFSTVVLWQNRNKHRELMPYVVSVLAFTQAFFLLLMVFLSNPFETMPFPPPEGRGLNPLLENPGMIIHPPTLLGGYVAFTIPFAFAIAALVTRKLGGEWLRSVRRWTLAAWIMLTFGNLAGAQWAYVELGWGGYWAWDAVENAGFMPWLASTAFLHSVMVQKRRNMLKVWNMVLIILTFVLAIFGTFLTRSGVLSSVHTFGESALGPFFLGFIGITLLGAFGLLFDRLPDLKGEDELDSFLSRESMFLLNNLLLIAATFAVFWGTVFPLVSEAVRGVKVSVSAPFFNNVVGPIFMGLIAVMGMCTLIGWRRTTGGNLLRKLIFPVSTVLVLTIILFIVGVGQWYIILLFSLCGLALLSIPSEWFREIRARHRAGKVNYWKAFSGLMGANKPRYGAYIVHLGIAVLALGIIGSSAFSTEKEATLEPGQTLTIKQYILRYEGMSAYQTMSREVVSTPLSVFNGNEPLGVLTAEKYFHRGHENPVTEVAIRSTLKEDLYVILAGWEGDTATFKVLVNPLVNWIWIGGGILILGTVITMLPERARRLPPLSQEEEK
jgi:cytochrome c-type biogenesis protein CcmF